MDATQLLSIWLKEREIQNQSKHTLQAYERDVSDFLEFCQHEQLNLNDVEATDLRQFLAEKVEQHQLSPSSLQRMLSAIRQFMKWAEQAQHMAFNPADDFQLKRQSRPLPGMVDIETVNQIIDQPAPENEIQQQMWLRDKAMLELLYSSGLRLAELQSLRIKDIDFNRQLLRIT
ncbi:MAG: site-specific integrase, partial [Gammaproteobacteria bacterium]